MYVRGSYLLPDRAGDMLDKNHRGLLSFDFIRLRKSLGREALNLVECLLKKKFKPSYLSWGVKLDSFGPNIESEERM